jgi:ribosomal-protein-alanine N-acetyltransferase
MDYFNQQSERLVFRKLTKEDVPSWTEFFENNEFLGFLGIDVSKSSTELATEWIEMQLWRYQNQGFGHLAVLSKDTKEFIGVGGILPREIESKQEYEIAYSLKSDFRGRGFATELAKNMLDFAQRNVSAHRFISIIHIDNVNSMRVAEKNGMTAGELTEFNGMPVRFWFIEKLPKF